MDTNEYLNCLMAEIGPIVDAESVVAYEGERWTIYLDKGAVDIRYIDLQNKFVMEVSIGSPLPENIASMSDMVLTYNYLYEEHGGARIAKISTDQGWVLLFDVFGKDITSNELAQIVMNFYLVSLQWSVIMKIEPTNDDDLKSLEFERDFNFEISAIRP